MVVPGNAGAPRTQVAPPSSLYTAYESVVDVLASTTLAYIAATSRPDASCRPPGGPVATKAWAGSSAAGTSAAVRLRRGDQLAPSSEEKVEKSCKLSRLKRRWSCPVDASKMGAGLPMVWPVSDCTCTIGDHVRPSSVDSSAHEAHVAGVAA